MKLTDGAMGATGVGVSAFLTLDTLNGVVALAVGVLSIVVLLQRVLKNHREAVARRAAAVAPAAADVPPDT